MTLMQSYPERKLLKKSQGTPLVLTFFSIDATAIIMQARMLKLHTRTAWCAACAALECETER
jgi:hypothetical protein